MVKNIYKDKRYPTHMKKSKGFFLIISLLLILNFVTADTTNALGPEKTGLDQRVVNAYENSVPLQYATYYLLGIKKIDNSDSISGGYGAATILIVFFLIWLILFVTFSDILVSFSAFSNKAVGWIVGGAITIIAANLGLVQRIALFFIEFTAIFGTIAVFIGIFTAFLAFLAISIGGGKMSSWALERRMNILAHQGQGQLTQGIQALRGAGREIALQGDKENASSTWWVVGVLLAIVVIIGIIIYILGGK